jgi:hypothetical protein
MGGAVMNIPPRARIDWSDGLTAIAVILWVLMVAAMLAYLAG